MEFRGVEFLYFPDFGLLCCWRDAAGVIEIDVFCNAAGTTGVCIRIQHLFSVHRRDVFGDICRVVHDVIFGKRRVLYGCNPVLAADSCLYHTGAPGGKSGKKTLLKTVFFQKRGRF